jgi:ankyrin repeat protein
MAVLIDETALMYASKIRSVEAVKMLLSNGESSRSGFQDKYGMTALMMAVDDRANDSRETSLEIVRMLLATGQCRPGIVDNSGTTALIYASQQGRVEIVRMLLATGQSRPEIVNKKGMLALTCALRQGLVEIVRLLLASGESCPGAIDNNGKSTLMYSFQSNNMEIIRLILSTGESEPNTKTLNYALILLDYDIMSFDNYKQVRSLVIRRMIVYELRARRAKQFDIVRWWSRLQNLASPTSNEFFHGMGGNFKGLTFDELKTDFPNVTVENYSFYLLGSSAIHQRPTNTLT